ncbi:MAG: hypothetical protein Q4Q19_03450 [Methanobrevibacter sp.]|nr:hypothetical protein [Methanobrevibacter sp.]
MAKKKEIEKEEKTEKEKDFNLQECFKEVNPFLRDGLERYIFVNNIKITNEKEFKKVLEKYGGF